MASEVSYRRVDKMINKSAKKNRTLAKWIVIVVLRKLHNGRGMERN